MKWLKQAESGYARSDVAIPGAQKKSTSFTLARAQSPKLRAVSQSEFVCPSGTSGECDNQKSWCDAQCDPSDPGYYDICVQDCNNRYHDCYYGQTTVTQDETFTPVGYYGSQNGWDPWYETWDSHIWDGYSGYKTERTYHTYGCSLDGTFGPYQVDERTWGAICWLETDIPASGGSWINDCRL